MSRWLSFVCIALGVAAPATAQTPARPGGEAVLQRTADDLAKMWQGAFDTANQVNFQERFNLPEEGWVARQHKIFARVDLPAFGPYVTYVEQYQGTPPDQLFRQRLYVHRIDAAAEQVVTDIYSFSEEDAATVAGAHDQDSRWLRDPLAEVG